MFLFSINIPTFHFSPSKIFLQLLVPSFKLVLVFFDEIVQKCVEYCKNITNFFFLTKHKCNMNF